VYRRKLPNDLASSTRAVERFRGEHSSVVVESTDNWYWLVDGLMEAGYRVQLANPSAMALVKNVVSRPVHNVVMRQPLSGAQREH